MSKTGVRLLPFGFSGSGFTLSMKEKMRERYSISIAAHCLYLLLEFVLLCDAIDLATALTRYMKTIRKVKVRTFLLAYLLPCFIAYRAAKNVFCLVSKFFSDQIVL